MKELKTINLKINELDRESMLSLMNVCNQMFNDYTQWAYKNGTYNKNKAFKDLYYILQEKYSGIKTALITTTRDMALACCKTNKLKGKIPTKKSNTLNLHCQCFDLRGQQLTLITSGKRHKEILHIPDHYKHIYENWKSRGATLSYDKKKKQFWLHITFLNPNEIKEQEKTKILGIDRGIYNIATTSDGKLYGGKDVLKIKHKHQYLRTKLQKKGTPAAKRVLRHLSGKEKRFVLDVNHCISKAIVNSDFNVFVLEKLKSMHDKKRHKNWNRMLHNWSYFQLEQFLVYKANALGKHIEYVHPAYTSQTCSACGKKDKDQRDKNMYRCSCGMRMHADLNAAINIKNKFLASQSEQVVIDQPYVS